MISRIFSNSLFVIVFTALFSIPSLSTENETSPCAKSKDTEKLISCLNSRYRHGDGIEDYVANNCKQTTNTPYSISISCAEMEFILADRQLNDTWKNRPDYLGYSDVNYLRIELKNWQETRNFSISQFLKNEDYLLGLLQLTTMTRKETDVLKNSLEHYFRPD